MKSRYFLLLAALFFLPAVFLSAQDATLWTPVSESEIPRDLGERRIIPDAYHTFRLDLAAMENLAAQASFELAVPMPHGGELRLKVVENALLPVELARKFPEIRTFSASAVDAPGVSAKLDWTPQGFHAMVFLPGESTVFVDPYAFPNREYYLSYYKRDFRKKDTEPFQCHFEEIEEDDSLKPGEDLPELDNDCRLRTYRLALACTGEYAQYHGGTTALALAAMTTSLNRVNGVYERESGVTMQLVPNNELLVFLNPNTDPYTNNNGSQMLTQNINTCNSVIGAANYDIGHVFSTGGGGVAYLSCVCASNKAGGVTGSSNPVGDPFDVDYVAHEFGHQFGGRHTQNNACNRDNNSSYEPGSASTIMGYAGICNPNVQSNSDDYFHINSLVLISNFIKGNGNSCAQITNTGNTEPIADAGANYVIPRSTPFVLTGTGIDPDGDPLTYCWEQYDRQVAPQPPQPTNTTGPAFRSLQPTASNQRYLPNLNAIVNNTNPTWEVLSSVGRNYTFRLTVRDNQPGASCAGQDEMVVTVAGGAGPFLVTSPNTPLTWSAFSQQTVTWNVANTTAAPVNCQNVDIFLSLDGGFTYPETLAVNVPNTGSALVNVPFTTTTTARVMVKGADNIFFDISNQNFTITAPEQTFSISLNPPQQQGCPGQPLNYVVALTPFGGYSGSAQLSVSGLPNGVTATISPNPAPIPGTATLTVTPTPGSGVQGLFGFTVTAINQFETQTTGGGLFLFPEAPGQPQLLSPANNAVDVTLTPTFQWSFQPNAANYHFQLASDPGFNNLLLNLPALIDNTFTIGGPLPEGTKLYWRVKAANFCGENGFTPAFSFTTLTTAPTDICVVVNSTGTPKALVPGTNNFKINIDIPGTVTDVNVLDVSITHPMASQMAAGIFSAEGTPVTLYNALCLGLAEQDLHLSFDEQADKNYSQIPCPPVDFQNRYRAQESLDAYIGEEMEGDWTLQVIVFPTAGAGTLNKWSLEICYIPGGTDPLAFELDITNASCFGEQDGTAAATPTGGSGTYTVQWSTGASGPSISGLAAGSYSVTVSDGVTTLSETFDVAQPPAILLNLFTTIAQNGDDGAIDLVVSGGVAPYTFQWSNGKTTEDLEGLEPGEYCVVVTDDTGCKAEACAVVSSPGECSPWVPTSITPSSTGCFIAWNAVPGAAIYRIRYQPVGNPPDLWVIKEVAHPFTSIALAGLVPGADYVFQTATLCQGDFTDWSGLYYFSTPEDPFNNCKAWVPGEITTTTQTATIQILPVSGASQYIIRYRPQGGSTWLTAQTLTTVFNLSGLAPGTTYEFRTQTRCANGRTSPPSAITYLFTTQSIGGKGLLNFRLQPNPAQNYLELNNLPDGTSSIHITTLSGERVLLAQARENYATIDIAHLPSGMYFITVAGEGAQPQTLRFIKAN